MSRQNTVEIIVKTKNATGAGLQSVRKDFAKQGDEIQRELDKTEAIVAKSGTRIGENLSKGVAKGAKDAGTKVTEAAEKLKRELAAAETAAYQEAAKRRAAEQKVTQRQAEKFQQEILKAEKDAYKEAAAMRAAEEKAIQKHHEKLQLEIAAAEKAAYKEADKRRAAEVKAAEKHADTIAKVVAVRAKAEAKSSGAGWAIEFGKGAVTAMGAVLATPLGAGAAAAGLSLGAGVVGGLTTALVGAGAVGLAAYLLKDNKQVKDTWTKTFKGIAEDSKNAAGVMADEFVASGKKTADIWRNDVKPSVEEIFKNAQPLVDKFTTGLGKAVADFLPGVSEAVKNSGPAVDGFTKLLGTLLKDTGDGLADLSTHSEDLGKSLELAGDGIGSVIKGTLGFMGDLSEAVARNEDDFRRWGRNIGDAADGVGKDIIRLTDLFAATGGDWKTGDGTDFKEAARRFLEGGEDKYDSYKPDPDNILAKLPLPTSVFGPVPGIAAKAFLDKRDLKAQDPTPDYAAPDSVKLVTEAYKQQDSAASKLTASLDVLNQTKTFGIEITAEELNKTDGLMSRQAALVTSLQETTKVTGDHTSANTMALASMLQIAAAGYPVHDSLMQMVSGMSDAQLAALGATVTTDALGNSVINIPGYKPITISADASQANPPLDGVINRLGGIQSKTVTIRVNSVYSSTGGLGYVNGQAVHHDQYNKGGWVGGVGGDYDSQPALLTPGEFVVTRKAAQQNGALLEQLNKSAGGSILMETTDGGRSGGAGSSGGGGGTAVIELRALGNMSPLERMFYEWLQASVRTGKLTLSGVT